MATPKPTPTTQYPASDLLTSFQAPKVAQSSSPVSGFDTNPFNLAKDIVQGTFRTGGSVALTLANKPELAIDPSAPDAQQRIQRILFGNEPIKSIATRVAEGEQKAKDLGFGKSSLPVAFGVVGALTAADFLPGGKQAKVAAEIAVSKNADQIAKLLKRMGVADEALPKLSRDLVNVTDPGAVGKLISQAPTGNVPKFRIPGEEKLPATEPKFKAGLSRQVSDEAINILKKDPESGIVGIGKIVRDPKTGEQIGGTRLFNRIGDALERGEIDINSLPDFVKRYNLTGEQTAKLFKDAATYSGRTLQALSRVEKELRAILPDIPIEKLEPTAYERFKSIWLPVDNFRRGLLVSQVATAMRNTISQGGRYSLEIANDAFSGVINKIGGKPESFAEVAEDINAIFRRTKPESRKQIEKILEENPIEMQRLLNTPVGDVALGTKVTNFLNSANKFQELMYRNLVFDAKVNALARRRKVGIHELNSDEIARAVDQALEITFSASPKPRTLAAATLRIWREIPFMTVLGNPFPRFMINAMQFIWRHSPAGGIMALLSPKSRALIAAGDPKAISQAITGSLMLAAATVVRNNPNIGGEKWYELKVGGKTVDMRPFAPFSTYLFIAELWSNPDRLLPQDILQGAVSINRIAGTGLVFVDLFQHGTPEGTVKLLKEFTGQYLGGFTVPFRTIADVVGQFRPEASVSRDVKEHPIIGPALSNIPGLNEMLPEYPSLFEEKPLKREAPLLRQTTGITLKTKPYILKEVDRLGISIGTLIPKTGDPTINRIITKATGALLDPLNDLLENSESYQNAGDADKAEILKKLVSGAKSEAKGQVAKEIAEIVYEELKNTDAEKRADLLLKLKNKRLMTDNIVDFLTPMIEANPF